MYETSNPRNGRHQRVTCTNFSTPVQAAGGDCKTVQIQARPPVAGTSGGATTANADNVIIFISSSTPTALTASTFNGLVLAPGDVVTLAVSDTSLIWVLGASGDSVNLTVLS